MMLIYNLYLLWICHILSIPKPLNQVSVLILVQQIRFVLTQTQMH